jgi:hypothetical protein
MELEFSHRSLYAASAAIALALLALLGRAITPVAGDGRPLVLSPAYVATVRYLKTARGWLDRMAGVDADLARVMAQEGNIYTQGRDAERAFERALAIATDVDQHRVPPALASLQAALDSAAQAHVQAARSVLRYVSAPSAENQQAVDEARQAAREALDHCRSLQEELWPAN